MPVTGTALSLAWSPQYLGFASSSCVNFNQCLRPPGYNTQIPLSGTTSSTFTVLSSDPSIATGAVQMTGPAGQGAPALAIAPIKAGSAVVSVSDGSGATTSVPVTVTTISSMTVALNNLPTATTLRVTVSAPPSADCPSFEGGYSFDWAAKPLVVMQNFPAMGTGPNAACLFSAVQFDVKDATNATIASKTFNLTLALGKDNSQTVSLP